jgi:hypothetical protein
MAGEAEAIQQLRTDLNTKWPKRNKVHDGTWGDTSHQARKSDHNTGDAMDVTDDQSGKGPTGDQIAAWAIRDPRVKYVIWNRRIYDKRKASPGWAPYSKWKKMPHDKHVHISVRQAARADTSPWAWTTDEKAPSINVEGQTKFEDVDPKEIAAKAAAEAKAKAKAKPKKPAPVPKKKPKKGKQVSDATSSGIHLYEGEGTIMLGTKRWMAAHVESPHTGGGEIAKGSSTVFVGPRQLAFARKYDPATDNLFVKEGQPNVLIGVA